MTTLTASPTVPDPSTARPGAGAAAGDEERLLDLLDARQPGRPLPGPCYTDPGVHDADLRLIWQRQWIFVGTVAELAEPGDFLTVELGTVSVLVVRDDDEQVRAFRNVCRHRGSRLVTETSGSLGNIVCGYHRWTYGTDGALRHAPQLAPPAEGGPDPACLSLRTVAVREVAGLVFCNLAAEPTDDIDDVAEVLAPYLTPHALERTKVAAQVDLVEQGNWKLTMENNRECYHCDGAHPELTRTFFATWGMREHEVPAKLRPAHERYLAAEEELRGVCETRGLARDLVEDLVDRPMGFQVQREALDGAGESFSLDGTRLVGKLLGELDEPRLGRCTLHVQPNLWLHAMADHVVAFSVQPIGVDRTLVRTTWLVHQDAVEGVDYDPAALTSVWRATNEQDAALVRLTQLGVTDPAYEPGPYTQSERQVDAFVSWYAARIREEARR